MAITGTWEDREQIRELYARYAYTVDFYHYPEWVRCFTEDGVFESPIFSEFKGPQGLLKFTAMYKESQGGSQVRHVMSNVTFQIAGETATGGCYLSYYHCKDGKVSLAALGRYEDQLRKVNGEWLFVRRKVHLDGHA
jgi:3-phenylpropionate/cinnamic acid dioxygenase small subunit